VPPFGKRGAASIVEDVMRKFNRHLGASFDFGRWSRRQWIPVMLALIVIVCLTAITSVGVNASGRLQWRGFRVSTAS